MALPVSRNTTYAVDSEVKSADLNDIQDNIIGGKHGALTLQLSYVHAFLAATGGGGANLSTDSWIWSAGTASLHVPINLDVGERIDAITVYGHETAVAYSAKIWETDLAGARTQKGPTKTSGTTTAWTSIGWTSADADIPLTIAAGKSYYVEIILTAAAQEYAGSEVLHVLP